MSDLPKGWMETELKDLVPSDAPILYGILQPGPDLEDGIPYVRPTEITEDVIQLDGIRRTSEAISKKYKRSFLAAEDIILSMVGTIGKVAIVPPILEGGNITQSAVRIRPNGEVIDPRYLAWLLRSPGLRRQYDENRLGTAVPRLNVRDIRTLKAPVPPLPEQRRIVARIEELISRLDAGVAALRHAKAQLQRYRQSVLAAAVTGQLTQAWREQHPDTEPAEELLQRILKVRPGEWTGRGKYKTPEPPDTEGLPDLPETWSWTNFETLANAEKHALKAGPFGSALKKEFYVPSGYKIYGQEQVIKDDPYFGDYYIDEDRFQSLKSCETKPGDFLISLVGTIGRTMIVPEDAEPGIINPRLVKMSLDRRLVDPRLLKIYLGSSRVKAFFKIVSHGGTMDVLNLTTLKALPIPLPPLAELPRILDEVEARTTAIDHLEAELDRQLTRSNHLRQSVLSSAFLGILSA